MEGLLVHTAGHDHDYSLDAVQRPNGRTVHVVKSGLASGCLLQLVTHHAGTLI